RCRGGYCVSKLLCVNNTYVEDSNKLQDQPIVWRIDENDECEDYLLVCCKIDQPPPKATEDSFDGVIIQLHCEFSYVIDNFNLFQDLDESSPSQPVCGQHNPDGLSFNFEHNDTIAQYGEYPWVVYIVRTEKQSQTDTYSFVCGGSLINPRFVVTTAHNTEGKSNLIARFGEWDTGTTKEPYPQKEISVRHIIKHPEYVQNPIAHDIALLLLAKNVEYARHIQPICLPQPMDDFDGRRCISNGWGAVQGVYATVMKKVSLPVLSRNNCTRMLRYGGLGPRYQLAQGSMCAGGEHNIGPCKGDGGSPLACETESEYVQNPIAHDIALLLLAKNVEYARHIQPICLPQPMDDFDGRRCISNGWGAVQGVYATVMKKVSLPVLSRNNCTRMLRYGGLGPRYQLAQGSMCAGGEHNIGPCKGDGGSPLACETESGSYVLAGILSWGIGCGGVNQPGVYVEVTKYLDWINQHLEYF
uniref:Peptidase S1 domain-containing protein n=1 Tax=Anopheles dirus TaxID=7168 RepID=A0A182NC71_9DIPT